MAYISTDFATIALAIRDKLINDQVVGNCYLGLSPEPSSNPPSDNYCVIEIGRTSVDQSLVTGAGNNCLYMEGDFAIIIFSRLALDELPRDDLYLTDPALGCFRVLGALIKSLQLTQLTDLTSQVLQAEPCRLLSIDAPIRQESGHLDHRYKQPVSSGSSAGKPPGWGSLRTHWQANWTFAF